MDPYITALTLLSRRELSVRQLRDRLVRRKFEPQAIDEAIVRLTRDRTVDDHRVATAFARLEATVRGRGRRRVLQAIQRLGIASDVAERAVSEVFGEVDEETLLDRAIEKRLRGASVRNLDARAKARLVRHLSTQGFAQSDIFRRLRALRG